jgi:DNA repair exonuclease SbcCD ATPase subunit
MTRLIKLRWSNAFSYGDNNSISLDACPLLQLVGKNGHGKSSIASILEEVLFNKNSKGIKRTNVLNRYVKSKSYTISLDFENNGSLYTITTTRGSTQTVVLTKDGKDISGHTSTATYKLIEEILGIDHKAFSQIVYQSDPFSLEFLTATDTNRKKFLIDLLNLTKYTKAAEFFKLQLKELNKELEITQAKLNSVKSWIAKFKNEDLIPIELVTIPEKDTISPTTLAAKQLDLSKLESTNKKIVQNNKYIQLLSSISFTSVSAPNIDLTEIGVRLATAKSHVTKLQTGISGAGPILSKCPSCGQAIDSSHKKKIVEECTAALPAAKQLVSTITTEKLAAEKLLEEYNTSLTKQAEIEKYHALIDKTLPLTQLVASIIEDEIKLLKANIDANSSAIDKASKHNQRASAHNARVEVMLTQKDSMEKDLEKLTVQEKEQLIRVSNLQILIKTFSPTGLVAYKIETLVKDLEDITNKYLLDMSDGRFQLGFKITSADKLDVIITDNGVDIDIFALSNGELARVNVSTLLAIRKLMQSLSNTTINLLILDETVESLDVDGKERLVEVLLKEEHLNTILVSHGFSHPLLEKINVVKENNVSRIE